MYLAGIKSSIKGSLTKVRRWKAPVMSVVLILGLSQSLPPVCAQQVTVLPNAYLPRDYPVDTLRRLIRLPAVPDTMKVFYLTRLAVHLGHGMAVDAAVPVAEGGDGRCCSPCAG